MSRPRSILVITRAFPPLATSGVHRISGLCRHLAESGWRVTVITAADSKEATLDAQLLDTVPNDVKVVRTAAPDLPIIMARLLKGRRAAGTMAEHPGSASKESSRSGRVGGPGRILKSAVDWLSWWLHVPDGCTGWLFPAIRAGLKAGWRERPDVIFSSAPVWTAHLVGMVISVLLRVPFVSDFRDPWYDSAFRENPYRAHRYANRLLEKAVVRRARRITCAWDGIRRHLAMNHPEKAGHMTTILNGFDPRAIDGALPVRLDAHKRVFLHIGNFYGPRSPVPLLEAVEQLHASQNGSKCVLFALVGPPFYGKRSLESMVQEYRVQDAVQVLSKLPHRQAVGLMKGADAALLFGQSGKESLASVPAKAYEYIAAGKPVLAIGAGSEACEIMEKGGCKVWRTSGTDPAQIVAAVADMCRFLDLQPTQDDAALQARNQFTRESMARQFEGVFLNVLANRKPRPRDEEKDRPKRGETRPQ